MTSGSVKVPLLTSARNSSFIGEEPVPKDRFHSTSIWRPATIIKVSYAEQSVTVFTDVLRGNNTVVLVGYTIEYKLDTTWMDEELNNAPEGH